MSIQPLLLAVLLLGSSGAEAHRLGGGRSSFGRSSATISRPAAHTQSTYRAATQPHPSPAPSASRRSLLDHEGPKPSEHVRTIIQHEESSGPGWLGTAFLVSMLSRHDLSSSDREWVQGRINSLKAQGDPEPPELLPTVKPKVAFTFAGIKPVMREGEPLSIRVAATNGQRAMVTCDAPAGAHVRREEDDAAVDWTPASAGAFLITCKAAGVSTRRLLRIDPVPPGNS